jgi:hypothetical protein
MNNEFIWWLGMLGMYMKEEHGVDLIKGLAVLDTALDPETLHYFYAQYKAGKEPKQVADILIEEAAKSS